MVKDRLYFFVSLIFLKNYFMATEKIKIDLDGRKLTVSKQQYIKAKTGDLKNFGYSNLTENEVSIQLEKILKGEELDIIGMFMEKDIVLEK